MVARSETARLQKINKTPAGLAERCAFSSIASNTGARSPGEELMTRNTSAVAVCCSRASRVSVIAARSPSR